MTSTTLRSLEDKKFSTGSAGRCYVPWRSTWMQRFELDAELACLHFWQMSSWITSWCSSLWLDCQHTIEWSPSVSIRFILHFSQSEGMGLGQWRHRAGTFLTTGWKLNYIEAGRKGSNKHVLEKWWEFLFWLHYQLFEQNFKSSKRLFLWLILQLTRITEIFACFRLRQIDC